MPRISSRDTARIAALTAARKSFDTYGNLRATAYDRPRPLPYGAMRSDVERAHVDAANETGGVTYVVWSYNTPIGYVRADGHVHNVNETFSMTTSHHMGRARLSGETFHGVIVHA